MTVIGYRKTSFVPKDSNETIHGYNIYCTYPIKEAKGNDGEAAERFYLTCSRLDQCGYSPAVGDNVTVSYNKFGKVSGMALT